MSNVMKVINHESAPELARSYSTVLYTVYKCNASALGAACEMSLGLRTGLRSSACVAVEMVNTGAVVREMSSEMSRRDERSEVSSDTLELRARRSESVVELETL